MKKQRLLSKVEGLVLDMMKLADEGDTRCPDDGCRVVFGVIRDSAYRIRKEVDRELGRRIPTKVRTG